MPSQAQRAPRRSRRPSSERRAHHLADQAEVEAAQDRQREDRAGDEIDGLQLAHRAVW
jgi:hypothetical protein